MQDLKCIFWKYESMWGTFGMGWAIIYCTYHSKLCNTKNLQNGILILLLISVLTLSTQTKAVKDRCFHFNALRNITDTHDINICGHKLNRNRKFFNPRSICQTLSLNGAFQYGKSSRSFSFSKWTPIIVVCVSKTYLEIYCPSPSPSPSP